MQQNTLSQGINVFNVQQQSDVQRQLGRAKRAFIPTSYELARTASFELIKDQANHSLVSWQNARHYMRAPDDPNGAIDVRCTDHTDRH